MVWLDFQARNLLGETKTKSHILLPRAVQRRPQGKTRGGHERTQPGKRLDKLDTILLQFVGDGPENGVGVFLLEPEQN